MEGFLTIIMFIFIAIVLIIFFVCLSFTIQYLTWFHLKHCKNCGHKLKYRGLKEEVDESYYLFYCSKCGSWERINREEFFHSIDVTLNKR